ncbi:MAG: GerAB/ArcD/ProY family transporter [Desulfitobacteriaceae bacterium]
MQVKKISGSQFGTVMFVMIVSTAILFVPAITVQKARQSAWLAISILPLGVGLVTLFLVTQLAHYYPGKTLFEYSESLFGKRGGKVIALAYAAFFLFGNILVIREFAEFLVGIFLPYTPVWVLIGIVVGAALYIVPKGPEVIARMTQFILPLFVIAFIFLVLLSIPEMKLARLEPFGEGGIRPILQGSVIPASWYGEIVLAAIFIPFLNKPQEGFGKGAFALLAIALVLTVTTLATLAVFGPDLTGTLMFPFLSLVRYIKISETLQRLDIWIMPIGILGILLKISVLYYAGYLGVTKVFLGKDSKAILYVLALLQVAAATYLFDNSLDLVDVLVQVWPVLALVFEVAIPVLLLSVTLLKKKWQRIQS